MKKYLKVYLHIEVYGKYVYDFFSIVIAVKFTLSNIVQ